MNVELLDKAIRRVPDFPKPGILFYDITGILTEPSVFRAVLDEMESLCEKKKIDAVATVESRGFVFGAPLADRLGLPLVLVRKKGKLPGKTICESYALEYGNAEIEIHEDDAKPGDKVLIVDDLIATGGTLNAVRRLFEKRGAVASDVLGVIGLPDLKYEENLKPMNVTTLINFHGK